MDAIVDLQTELICQYNKDLKLTFVNRAYSEWVGIPKEQLCGTEFMGRIPLEERDRAENHIKALTAEHPVAISTHHSIMADGSHVIIEWTDRAFFDENGNIAGYLGVGRDVTAREQQAQQILALKDLLASVLDTMQDSILYVTLPDQRLIYASAALEKIFGYPAERFIAEPELHRQIIHPDDLARVTSARVTCMKDGFSKLDHRIIGRDGQIRWLHRRVWVNFDSAGKPISLIDTATDITERKKAELAFQASEKRYRQMFEVNGLPKLIIDPTTRQIVDANPAAAEFYGYDLATFKTLNVSAINPSTLDEIKANIVRAAANRLSTFHLKHRLADGTIKDVEIFSGPLDQDGQQLIYSTITDVTEREQAKAALEEANSQLEGLVAERTAELEKTNDRLVAIFNHSGDAIVLLNIQQGIQQANYTFETLFAVSPENYLGKGLDTFLELENQASFDTIVHEVATAHRQHQIEARTSVSGIPVELSIAPVNRSALAVTNLVCIIRDISERKLAEAALKQYAAEIEDLYNNAPTGYHSLNADGVIIQINDTELNWLGYRREEVVGQLRILDILSPISQANFIKNFPTVLQTGLLKDLEMEFRRKDGSIMHVLVSATAVKDELERFVYSRSTVIDNSDLKTARQEIAEERNLLRTVIDTVPDFIYVKDTHHRMVLNNLSHARALGVSSPSEAVGKTDYDFFPDFMVSKFYADEIQLLETGQAIMNTEERSLGPDGHEIWALTSKVPFRNLSGEITGLVGITHDISERKKTEEALKTLSQRLQLATEAGGIGVWDWNLETDNIFMDDQLLALHAVSREMIGSSFSELWSRMRVHPDDLLHLQNELNDTLTGIKPLDAVFRIYHPDNSMHYLKIKAIVFRDEAGKPVRMIGVNWDVSVLKEAEENLRLALEKEKELGTLKSRFVSMASHEFRTPLSAILATTETLTLYRERMDKNQLDARLDKIRQQVLRLKGIMDDVLQLARMQSGRVDYKPARGDLDLLCREIVEEYESQETKPGRLHYKCPHSPIFATFDTHLMRQVISNLISNALKYSPDGKSVNLKLTHDRKQLVLVVQDHGIGIPSEDIKHLFEPFHRAGNVGSIPGTGLGLNIAKQAVETHDGTISVESEQGKGTIFTVMIPLAPVKPETRGK